MSRQRVRGTQPQARKAAEMHDEERDTTHPKMVTEFLVSFLMAVGKPAETDPLWKNTRDEVNWHGCLLPWRRSPVWLIIRVVLQLTFARAHGTKEGGLYKAFMVYHMSKILEEADSRACNFHADTLLAMSAKVHRRLCKLENLATPLQEFVHTTLRQTRDTLQRTSTYIQKSATPSPQLSDLKSLDFKRDTLTKMPKLESFIDGLYARQKQNATVVFQPQYALMKHHVDEIPGPSAFRRANRASDLIAFENWVASHLDGSVEAQRPETDVCGKLRSLLEEYYVEASKQYSGDPESTSLMILTILELWVACDKVTLTCCVFLNEYDPGVPRALFQTLVLPFRSQMERLHRVESYLKRREHSSHISSRHALSSFGEPKSFSVRWVQQSKEHQALFADIQRAADQARNAKLAEFDLKKQRHADLINLYHQHQCTWIEIWSADENIHIEEHDKKCKRCKYLRDAESITIDIHEWPLPHRPNETRSTVFELRVPKEFGHWRAAMTYVLSRVLGMEYSSRRTPLHVFRLTSYKPLSRYFKAFGKGSQSIALASETKSNEASHRRTKNVGTSTEQDVCVRNGLSYRYYDQEFSCFVGEISPTNKVEKACAYTLPPQSVSLQKFLSRPSERPNGLSLNHVIATQSDCPQHLSMEEYKALCSLPLGIRIQWQNILVQLHAPSINFKSLETALFILQCIFQAGPSGSDAILRESHRPVREHDFAIELLSGLQSTVESIKENWQAYHALFTCISLACRLLSLNKEVEIRTHCLRLLSNARATAMNWLWVLKAKIHTAATDEERISLRTKVLDLALIAVSTFDVDNDVLRDVIDYTDVSNLLVCSMIIRQSDLHSTDPITIMLHRRWQRLSYRSYEILIERIKSGHGLLDHALQIFWPSYRGNGRWHQLSDEYDNWLVNKSAEDPTTRSGLTIHFNILDGELLANGLPLGRLPTQYECHPVYQRLFGKTTIDVMPSTMAGSLFSTKNNFHGYTLHIGMSPSSDLLIHAVGKGRRYELIPSSVFREHLPIAFVEEYVHWYDMDNDCVEFRSQANPLEPAPEGWILSRVDLLSPWRLSKEGQSLVTVNSNTSETISRLLACLEDTSYIHCIVDDATTSLDIELPRLQLGFHVMSNADRIDSRQFRGMAVDPDQSIGSLVGLESMLVLRSNTMERQRMVIIPFGDARYYRKGEHISVSIVKDSVVKAYTYNIDDRLGRLIDDGSLNSKLWLCYLHGLTSFCLPDGLTQRTGTEQALSILDSAAVKSFDTLTEQNIRLLDVISRLSPRRLHYPENLRVMQEVVWQQGPSIMAQHGRFHTIVRRLLDKHARSKPFYPDSYVEIPETTATGVDQRLEERDAIRSSTLRVADFGAEDFTTEHDVVYPSRDTWQGPYKTALVTSITDIVYHLKVETHHHLPHDLSENLWKVLAKGPVVVNDNVPIQATELVYDAKWLDDSIPFVTTNWLKLHRLFTSERERISRPALAMWLSLLAYTDQPEAPLLYVLAIMYTNPESFTAITLPEAPTFWLQYGATPDEFTVTKIVRSQAVIPKRGKKKGSKKPSLKHLVNALIAQWDHPGLNAHSLKAHKSSWTKWYDTEKAVQAVGSTFKHCSENRQFREYLDKIEQQICPEYVPFLNQSPSLAVPKDREPELGNRGGFVTAENMFQCPAPPVRNVSPPDLTRLLDYNSGGGCSARRLSELISRLRKRAQSDYERTYIDRLEGSLVSMKSHADPSLEMDDLIDVHLLESQIHYEECVNQLYKAMLDAMGCLHENRRAGILHLPRLSPGFFLQNLARARWQKLPQDWKGCLIQYGLALSMLQQSERRLACSGNRAALVKELSNTGHTNWDAREQPETLLLEIESGITIREVQEQIASRMRSDSADGDNQIMQLNMGEGKSSVIVPMVAAALADGSRLVRIIVAKPQAKQMFEMMTSKFGGLLNRPVYHAPFSRNVKLGLEDLAGLQLMYEECMAAGGVLLVQPEHILSFQLMTIERSIAGGKVAKSMMKTLDFLNASTRDIVDESDENFSVKFELMYTMGTQRPIDHSPGRWICIQEVLDIIREIVPSVRRDLPDSVELFSGHRGSFPRTRFIREDAQTLLLQRVTTHICHAGLSEFPMARQSEETRLAVCKYISQTHLSTAEIQEVEENVHWPHTARYTLLLLRGLIAEGVLGFVFGRKRWRVDYGLDSTRRPVTRLAVPYRAKDNPTARSEFGHPDVVILLTSLSCYYSGLSDDDLFLAFGHISQSDQADIEYQAWVKDADGLPLAFQQLGGVNLEDSSQCTSEVFPHLRYGKAVVDYFLSHLVFPKEMREFPHKLSASGWDIGRRKTHPTTGFSGTNDSRVTLPLSVKQLDLPDQAHTNAMVLGYLLRPENSISLMGQRSKGDIAKSDAEKLLSSVISLTPPVRVILDVGAQILELDNLGVAKTWLSMTPDDGKTQAVAFFDDNDHICVLDRNGQIEQLHTSPFATQLDLCLVFLDEVHTRGTDLRLPQNYRAAVTLGANLTKDRLVQACMRMRELGRGQSVVFCVPDEIGMKMRTHAGHSDLTVSDILEWAITETWSDAKRSMPLWTAQGMRHRHHEFLWAQARGSHESITKLIAAEFLEEEAQSLEARYKPRPDNDHSDLRKDTRGDDIISQRCRDFGPLNHRPAALSEEQERELAPEIQQERQVQKALTAVPLQHEIHPDVRHFISSGMLVEGSQGYMPALKTLATTSAAIHLDLRRYAGNLKATTDFARCVHRQGKESPKTFLSDSFQRSVQWILTGGPDGSIQHMLIISPFEAQELLPEIEKSTSVSLHLYAPRLNLGHRPLDALDLYTVPRIQKSEIPGSFIMELNLFAGQLYFDSMEEYTRVSRYLRTGIYDRTQEQAVNGGLDDRQRTAGSCREEDPLKFFKVLLTKIRRNCESIRKTHIGHVLDDRLLGPDDFSLTVGAQSSSLNAL